MVLQRRSALWLAPCLAFMLAGPAMALAPGAPRTALGQQQQERDAHSEPLDPAPETEPKATLPVPEPGALLLVGTGLVGIALTVRRRRRRN